MGCGIGALSKTVRACRNAAWAAVRSPRASASVPTVVSRLAKVQCCGGRKPARMLRASVSRWSQRAASPAGQCVEADRAVGQPANVAALQPSACVRARTTSTASGSRPTGEQMLRPLHPQDSGVARRRFQVARNRQRILDGRERAERIAGTPQQDAQVVVKRGRDRPSCRGPGHSPRRSGLSSAYGPGRSPLFPNAPARPMRIASASDVTGRAASPWARARRGCRRNASGAAPVSCVRVTRLVRRHAARAGRSASGPSPSRLSAASNIAAAFASSGTPASSAAIAQSIAACSGTSSVPACGRLGLAQQRHRAVLLVELAGQAGQRQLQPRALRRIVGELPLEHRLAARQQLACR